MTSASSAASGWRDYWRDNRLAACAPEDPAAAGAIQTYWVERFARCAAHTRVLDLATGNGVLLLWAAQAAREQGKELSLTGVDSANIDPVRFLPEHATELSRMDFYADTRLEALPFADAGFDLLVSQYGLEYAKLDTALAEAARVLAPGGSLECLMHSDASGVVAQGREQLGEIDRLLAKDGPLQRMAEFAEARASGRKVQRATRALTDALRRAEAHIAAHPGAQLLRQICAGVLETANALDRYRPDDVQQWLRENRRRLRAQRQRIRDLQAASLGGERLRRLEALLAGPAWCEVVFEPLLVGEQQTNVGLLLRARRSAEHGR